MMATLIPARLRPIPLLQWRQRLLPRSIGIVAAAVLITLIAPTSPDLRAAQDQVRIDFPAEGAVVSGIVEIKGRAVGSKPEEFDFYRLYVGLEQNMSTLRPIGRPFNRPVEEGVLATANAGLAAPGDYIVVLRVFDKDGSQVETQIRVTVAAQATPTPFTVLTPLPTSDAFVNVGNAPARPTMGPVTIDELDASQPFQPYTLPELSSGSVAPIQPLGPGLTPVAGDPIQVDPVLHDIRIPKR
jgi:hypothetical protein